MKKTLAKDRRIIELLFGKSNYQSQASEKDILDLFTYCKSARLGPYFGKIILKSLKEGAIKDYIKMETGKALREQDNVKKFYNQFLKAVGGKPVISIKTFLDFPFVDHDIDVVLVGDNIEQYTNLLKSRGYQVIAGSYREPDKFYVKSRNCPYLFHVHKNISWNNSIYLDKRRLQRTSRNKYRLRPEDDMLILIAHSIFENFEISLLDLVNYTILVQKYRIDWDYITSSSGSYGWKQAVEYFKITIQDIQRRISHDRHFQLPYLIPYPRLLKLECKKLQHDLANLRLKYLARDIYAYAIDVPAFARRRMLG